MDGNNNIRIHVYGPYGTQMNAGSSTFAVYGDIKSLFEYHRQYLEGLGAYHESWKMQFSMQRNTVRMY